MSGPATTPATTGEAYLLLADISGYSSFLAGVEVAHQVEFSGGIPAGYAVLGALLEAVIAGVQPGFEVAKLEGDAVFAIASAGSLDGHGGLVIEQLRTTHAAFRERRDTARAASDELCTACPVVGNLDLKMVLHRGRVVRQAVGAQSEVLGPSVNVAHRLLKNTIEDRIGRRPYLFLTDAAAAGLGEAQLGIEHAETYPDIGTIEGRIVELGRP